MPKSTPDNDGIRVLVVGSHRFQDQSFVNSMLNGFANHFDISAILSGPFSGTDTYAREWAKEHGIAFEPVNISPNERMELKFFDAEREIPELVLRNDPMFQRGYEKIRDSGATVVLAIPNPEGDLGPTCACLKRMASVIGIECIDGSMAMKQVASRMEQAVQEQTAQAQQSPKQAQEDAPVQSEPASMLDAVRSRAKFNV